MDLINANRNNPVETAHSSWRRRILWLCVVGWTVIVGFGLWWLLRDARPSVWIVREADSPPTGTAEKGDSFFTAEMGLQRVYPWVLLGPYVALVASLFPLERDRLRLSLPLNMAACVAFVAASQTINARTRVTTAFMIIQSEPGQGETNRFRVEISNRDAGKLRLEQMFKSPTLKQPPDWPRPHGATGKLQDVSNTSLTNLFVHLQHGFNPPPPPGAPRLSLWATLLDLLAYGAVVGLAHSVHFYRRFREREHRALFLESNLANARLNALRAQLQPHFLFNSLNAIAALLRRDPRLAEGTLMSLSELLRLALSQFDRQEISLREEMQFVERYLEIQQTRFGNKLRVEQDIEPAALDCLVPALVLQPLIENAIRHGIEPAEEAGLVRLTAHQQKGKLVLIVEDDGVGLTRNASDSLQAKTASNPPHTTPPMARTSSSASLVSSGTGIGLMNLTARLETLYGAGQILELAPRSEGGVTVRLEIPWHPAVALETPDTCHPE